MDRKRLRAEDVLHSLGLFRPARALYQATVGRDAKRQATLTRNFFAGLLSAGALVFDIGANLGNYAEIFASLGARVVAVEPNPDCVSHIKRSYAGPLIEVIQAAAGATGGVATLRLAERSDMSSMSDRWIRAIQKAQHADDSLWAREMTVPVVSLDSLVQKYGVPDFIKIDVEGFEEEVLDGLTIQPRLLSFEFNTQYLDATMRCLEKSVFGKGSTFNFVVGEPSRFDLPEWQEIDGIRFAIGKLRPEIGYGDILVRRNSLQSDARGA